MKTNLKCPYCKKGKVYQEDGYETVYRCDGCNIVGNYEDFV